MNNQEKDLPNWEQATFKNSVIFAWIVSEHPEVCLELLQLILPELAVTEIFEVISEYTQKASLKNHGVRFDVYTEDDRGRMFDLEMQVVDQHDLSKRISYYQSNLVRRALASGCAYNEKADTYVIFICDFDYGRSGLPLYSTKMILHENRKVLDTGVHNIILNIKFNKLSLVSKRLAAFLNYLASSKVTDDFTRKLDELVTELKTDTRKKDHYMEYKQEIASLKAYIREETRKETREATQKEEREKTISVMIKKMVAKGYDRQKTLATILEFTNYSAPEVSEIYDKLLVK